jgi:hypothetical protein
LLLLADELVVPLDFASLVLVDLTFKHQYSPQ